MEYKHIVSISGLSGLFGMVAQKKDGAIVKSLADQSVRFVSNRVHTLSQIEAIEVYTQRDNVNLIDVLKAMEASTETIPEEKNAAAVKQYFTKIYPTMDFERVYMSDMKKMIKWLAILKTNHIALELSTADAEKQNTQEAELPAAQATPALPIAEPATDAPITTPEEVMVKKKAIPKKQTPADDAMGEEIKAPPKKKKSVKKKEQE